jgi:hypothetical protein
MSYERIKNLVDIDDNIFAALVVEPAGEISELFIATDSDLDKEKIEKIAVSIDIKSTKKTEGDSTGSIVGRHKWDVLEYEKFKFIKLYPDGNLARKMIVVIAACTKDPGDVVDSVIGYMDESEGKEETPINLFS